MITSGSRVNAEVHFEKDEGYVSCARVETSEGRFVEMTVRSGQVYVSNLLTGEEVKKLISDLTEQLKRL